MLVLTSVGQRTVSPLFKHVVTVQIGDALTMQLMTLLNYLIFTFCMDSVIPTKKVVTYTNDKPWAIHEFESVLKEEKKLKIDLFLSETDLLTGDPLENRAVSREV